MKGLNVIYGKVKATPVPIQMFEVKWSEGFEYPHPKLSHLQIFLSNCNHPPPPHPNLNAEGYIFLASNPHWQLFAPQLIPKPE